MEAASTQRKNLVRSLDPRMKLLLVVVISTATMFTPSREVVAWNYIMRNLNRQSRCFWIIRWIGIGTPGNR